MSITPSPLSQPGGSQSGNTVYAQPPASGGGVKVALIILGVLMVAGMAGLYYYSKGLNDRLDQLKSTLDSTLASQGETLQRLSQRLEKADARTNDLQGTVTVTQNRLGMTQSELQKAHQIASDLAQRQKESAEKLGTQLSQLQQDQTSTKGAVGSLSTDVNGVKGDVQSTKQELASTQARLQSVIGDLGVQSGLIAHNGSELEELRMRGERDYLEFDVRKSNKSQKVGTVQVELKKTDPKKGKYTISLTTDDKTIEKKDKTVSEPVQFYQQGFRAPAEIVVNQVYKDRIVGYISTPKKKEDRTPMKAAS